MMIVILCVTLSMTWFNFIIIKFTCCLVLGILIGAYYPVSYSVSLIAFGVGGLFWLLIFLLTDKKVNQPVVLGVITYGLILVIGVLVVSFHTHTNHKTHYSRIIPVADIKQARFHVFKRLKSSGKHQKYLGKITAVNAKKATGLILITADTSQVITIDDVLYASVKLSELRRALNPHQFDYSLYMKRQQVRHQIFVNKDNSIVLKKESTLYGQADVIRKRINATLETHFVSEQNLSVINALLLGQRQQVSKATYKSFTSSGAVHILAISGLHIGLLLVVLTVFFKPIAYFKHGKIIASVGIIGLLWVYAFIVGMSASVIRAVTMFSLFTIAIYSNRITNTYNTLVLSAFILLICDPYYLFDIGFQMSYAAVIAIIWIKPLFDRLWYPKNIIAKRLWDVFSITLAAQLGVLPIALFYFHQFPGLFFISNMVIIPVLGMLLGLGIITLIFAYFGWIPELVFQVFDQCVTWLVDFVTFIATQEQFIFTELPFNEWNLITVYGVIICSVLAWQSFSFKRLTYVFISVIGLQLVFLSNKWHSKTNRFVVFNQYKATCIGVKYGQNFNYYSKNLNYKSHVESYMVSEFINQVKEDSLRNVFIFKGKTILVIDEKAVYNTSFRPEVILLTESPKLNLERLISVLQPKQLVVDNTNYKSYVEKWKQTCVARNIPFYVTNTQGAYVLK